jgi:hypothetical protein
MIGDTDCRIHDGKRDLDAVLDVGGPLTREAAAAHGSAANHPRTCAGSRARVACDGSGFYT